MKYMNIVCKWDRKTAISRAQHLASLGRRKFVVGKLRGHWKIVPTQDSERIQKLQGHRYMVDPTGKVTDYD